MSLILHRICDVCGESVECDPTYFTERIWICNECNQNPSKPVVTSCNFTSTPSPKTIDGTLVIETDKDSMIDISRTIGVALSVGKAECELGDGRKLIVKIKV